jgi:hypothetical protein
MTIKFYNPIGGRKIPLNLSSLFLVDPNVILKLSGTSISGLMKEVGFESLYKRILNPNDENRILRVAHDIAAIPDLPKCFVDALSGDTETREIVSKLGVWEAFALGSKLNEGSWPQPLKFCIGVERSTHQSLILFHERKYDEALALLMESPLVRLLLWPEAIDILHKRNSLDALLPLRGMIALEIILSRLAGYDAHICHSLAISNSLVLDVLPTTLTEDKNPTALFFKWIKRQIDLPTISAILNAKKTSKLMLDESLLKRWSNGTHMPSEKALKGLLEAFFDDPVAKDIWMLYYATKCLNFIGYQIQHIQKVMNTAATSGLLKDSYRPWPDMPFGFKTIETWFENRYPYWFEYHCKQITGEDIKPSRNN